MKTLMFAAVAALSCASPASAAVITRTYDFAATDFTSDHGAAPPFAAVKGSVTVSFDPAVSAASRPGAVVNMLDMPFRRPVSFSYRSGDDVLAIASADGGHGANAFALTINNASADDRLLAATLNYSAAGFEEVATARKVAIARRAPSARLPEPATWTMLVLGFGAIGWVARRRQRRAEAAFTERMRRIAAGEAE